MTVEKNLAFPLSVAGIKKAEISGRVVDVARMLGLEDRLRDRPGQLSGGQRQRVALGRAIIREPSIFLLDEPLSNLDAELRVRMRREIVQLQRRLNKTTVHVTHDQSEALTMADRIALLRDGRLVQLGTPEELYDRPANRFAAEFVGSPRINILDAKITENRIAPFGTVCPRKIATQMLDGELLVGLRPESVVLDGDGDYAAKVISSEYLGDRCVAHLEFQSQDLTVTQAVQPPEPGQTVRFSINARQILYFDPKSGRRLEAGE
jgi:ABC-type sugar transport system ATPase subunit